MTKTGHDVSHFKILKTENVSTGKNIVLCVSDRWLHK